MAACSIDSSLPALGMGSEMGLVDEIYYLAILGLGSSSLQASSLRLSTVLGSGCFGG